MAAATSTNTFAALSDDWADEDVSDDDEVVRDYRLDRVPEEPDDKTSSAVKFPIIKDLHDKHPDTLMQAYFDGLETIVAHPVPWDRAEPEDLKAASGFCKHLLSAVTRHWACDGDFPNFRELLEKLLAQTQTFLANKKRRAQRQRR